MLLAEGQAYGDGWDEGREALMAQLGIRTDNQAYVDGWLNGRAAMLEEFEDIALHWEQERNGGAARYRNAATWLRSAIRRVRENRPYTPDDALVRHKDG